MLLAGCISFISYNHAVIAAESAEIERLKSIVHTFAIQAESLISKEPNGASSSINENELSHLLFEANRNNGLSNGLELITIDQKSKQTKYYGENSNAFDQSTLAVKHLKESLPSTPVTFGLESLSNADDVFYGFPISVDTDYNTVGYLYAQENIGTQLKTARNTFLRQIGITLAILLALGVIGYSQIRKVFKYEVYKKKKLDDYIHLAEERNSELHTMSVVLQHCHNLILLTDNTGRIEWLNHSFEKKNNFSEQELEAFVGKTLNQVSHYSRIQEVLERVNRSKEKWVYETKSYDSNKNEFWASTTVTPILNDNGDVEKLIFIDSDITKMKAAEIEIAKIANITKEDTNPIVRIQVDGTVLFANNSGERLLQHWGTEIGRKIQKTSILKTLAESIKTNKEQKINMEVDNRIYGLRFNPMPENEYANIYGEDITELHIAEGIAENRNNELEQSNLQITDSITYARRIQEAILPNEDQIRKFFKDSFVMNKPKDIVSGDFFWIREIIPNQKYLVALADCTGHGVPGAMMSIVGHGILNELVDSHELTDPASILHGLNREIIRSLKQKREGDSSDGMDISIVQIDMKNLEVTYAGAYQPVYWMNGKLNVFKGDRQPIGGFHHDYDRKFTNHVFQVSKGDSLYLTSDGYKDQFGGPLKKKFKSRQFEEMIEENHKFSMQAQSYLYENKFNDWKGRLEQVDDVSLIGIKF